MPELIETLANVIESLISEKGVDTFYFGSKSEFDDLCYKTVTGFKKEYPHIRRVYVRAAFQYIPDWYEDSLLTYYEDTYFHGYIGNAGKASYVERNREMINRSVFLCCVL